MKPWKIVLLGTLGGLALVFVPVVVEVMFGA